MMLVNVNRTEKTIHLVSIPRDTLIFCEYSVPKINSAYGWAGGGEAGMQELLLRVSEVIGFEPDGYAVIDLSVFEQLVDLMGGITFDVPVDMHYSDPTQGLNIDLQAGKQHLNGEQAMQVARFRSGYATADLGRIEVQRSLVSAALRQWVSPKGALHLSKAVKLVLEHESDKGQSSVAGRKLPALRPQRDQFHYTARLCREFHKRVLLCARRRRRRGHCEPVLKSL